MSFRVALVAMPWPLADRPSIQLAALKAYLLQIFPGTVQVHALHPYVSIASHLGLDLYQRIAERSWLAEAIYAPLVFPEQLSQAQALVHRVNGRRRGAVPLDVKALGQRIHAVHEHDRLFEQAAKADLVGISVCLATHCLLYLVRAKVTVTWHPGGPGVVVCGELGKASAFQRLTWW
jgi:hypothetical protein